MSMGVKGIAFNGGRGQSLKDQLAIAMQRTKTDSAALKFMRRPETKFARGVHTPSSSESNRSRIKTLTKVLGYQQGWMRALAAKKLGKMGPAAKTAVPALIKCLGDGDISVRLRAIGALRRIKDPRAIPEFIKCLSDNQWGVRRLAACSLGDFGLVAKAAIPALIKCLGDRNAAVRMDAAYALGEFGPAAKAAVPSLRKCLSDRDWYVRLGGNTDAGLYRPCG